jgi:hypothetical protein
MGEALYPLRHSQGAAERSQGEDHFIVVPAWILGSRSASLRLPEDDEARWCRLG